MMNSRVPKSGDVVRIRSGQSGRIVLYHQRHKKYEVQLEDEATFVTREDLELISTITTRQDDDLHVLVPCHLVKERDLALMLRGMQSLLRQTTVHFTVLISITGPLVAKATDALQALLQKPLDIEWHLVQPSNNEEYYTEFQHLQKLHLQSQYLNPHAWILFLKQKDMFHPQRIRTFRQLINNAIQTPFSIGAKLLLNEERMNTSEGRLQDFIASDSDFDLWTTNKGLSRNVTCINPESKEEAQHGEYFDYCVPSHVIRRFFERTPLRIQLNPNCDVRFWAMLDELADLEPISPHPWLLVHYPVKRFSVESTYNRHDWISGARLLDDPSLNVVPTEFDKMVVRRYAQMSPMQVTVCQLHFERIIVQYFAWNENELDDQRVSKCREIDLCHGRGFGKTVWKHCEEKVQKCFSSDEIRLNRDWNENKTAEVAVPNTYSLVSIVRLWIAIFQFMRSRLGL